MRRKQAVGLGALTLLAVVLVVVSVGIPGSDDGPVVVETAIQIGPSGGRIVHEGVMLAVPAGALAHLKRISVTTSVVPVPAGMRAVTPVYRFEPAGLVFAKPVAIELAIGPVTGPIRLYWSKPAGWEPLESEVGDTVLRAAVTHLGAGFAGY